MTNAIVVWGEHFAAALLRLRSGDERLALARLVLLNLAVLAVLAGVHSARPVLVAGGGSLLAVIVAVHAVGLMTRIHRGLGARLGDTVLFYVAADAALIGGTGLGVLMGAGGAGSVDAYRAMRLAHAHLNVGGWIGLSVVGTQFTLWPTVLRTRMVPGLRGAARTALPLMVGGLIVTTAGLLARHRAATAAGLLLYGGGLAAALVPFVRTMLQRRPRGAAAWMLAAGTGWLVLAVVADLVALLGSVRVVDLDGRLGRLVPAVAVGFGLQTVAGALTYLLPAVLGRGPQGNRWLTRLLEAGWPPRVAALNLGVVAVALDPAGGWVALAGRVLVGLGLGSFVVLAAAALAWRVGVRPRPRPG